MWFVATKPSDCAQPLSPRDLAARFAELLQPIADDPRAKRLIERHTEFAASWQEGQPVPPIYRARAFHNEQINSTGAHLFLRRAYNQETNRRSLNSAGETVMKESRKAIIPANDKGVAQ